MYLFTSFLRTALILVLGLGLPLRAQLDPRLQTTNPSFLNLYMQSAKLNSVKPELLTVLDFTGSMNVFMFHKDFPNKNTSDESGYDVGITFILNSPAAGRYDCSAFLGYKTGNRKLNAAITSAGLTTLTLNGSLTNYPTSGTVIIDNEAFKYTGKTGSAPYNLTGVTRAAHRTVAAAHSTTPTVDFINFNANADAYYTGSPAISMNLSGGILVRPDGSTLEYANNGDTEIKTKYNPVNPNEPAGGVATLSGELALGLNNHADVRNWIRSASHVRFTYLAKTFDIPIGWTALLSSSVVRNPTTGEYRNQYMTYPLRSTLLDPASNTEVEIERSYRVLGNTLFGSSATKTTLSAAYVGHRPYHYDWIWGAASTVPQYPAKAAFANGIPPFTRTTATKNTFMILWSKYWNKVLWANRFIHDWRDATLSGSEYPVTEGGLINNNSGAAGASARAFNLSNDSRTISSAGNHLTTPVVGGTQRAWVLMNGNSYNSLVRLSSVVADGYTMLNYAMVNALAQYNDPNNVFNDVETGVDAPIQCRKSFLLLFTDGQPNSETGTPGSTVSPYYDGKSTNATYLQGGAATGNKQLKAKIEAGTTTVLDPGVNSTSTAYASQPTGQWFNILTLAAVAAHGADPDLPAADRVPNPATYPAATAWPTTYSATADSVFPFIPFALKKRGTVPFTSPHLITTMTVGVSLPQANWTGNTPGAIKPSDPKFRLLAAAAMGDPNTKTWNTGTILPFALKVPGQPEKGKADGTCYYFDATDPDKLTESLDAAFFIAGAQSNINATSSPNIPFVGGSFGHQIYLGKFQPPATGGVIWPGDLLMFATKEDTLPSSPTFGTIKILDKVGAEATKFDNTTAEWSASDSLFYTYPPPTAPLVNGKRWTERHLFTRLPNATKLIPFTDVDARPASPATEWPPSPALNGYTTPFSTLKAYLAAGFPVLNSPVYSDATKKLLIQLVAGADTGSSVDAAGRPYNNRNATIMGDVINSSPQVLEYTYSIIKPLIPATSPLASFASGTRFRILLVGTNQGWLHAFGEVSIQTGDKDPNNGLLVYTGPTKGVVDELWAFLPTDFLANLDSLSSGTSPHRFMVDGTPAIYFLDLPPTGGGYGNGTFDIGASTKERAVAVIGLGQGGRSYYAMNLGDPFKPSLLWSLVPDEAASDSLISKMGLSTCAPAFGRVMYSGVLKDVVFLGGGHSDKTLDGNFPTWPPPSGQETLLGRSVMALDVYSGTVLASGDLTSVAHSTGVGPVSKGLVPFEFFLNSGMAQRAYFLDYAGGLWSWGAQGLNASAPFTNYRIDTSDLAKWTTTGAASGSVGIRKVAQDQTTDNARYTTFPAPFRVDQFPGAPFKAGDAVPAAVGIAMISGDRNNPLDSEPISGGIPTQHRLTVVFDRQDSAQWPSLNSGGILDDQLLTPAQMGSMAWNSEEIKPGDAKYYLAPTSDTKFGYRVNLPVKSGNFTPKGITSPSVVAGSLFYTYFNPTSSDPCIGGAGTSQTRIICDVINPIPFDARTTVSCVGGNIGKAWAGVPSDLALYGTRGVVQGGAAMVNPIPPSGQSLTTLQLQTMLGRNQERFPKVRVWRTVR